MTDFEIKGLAYIQKYYDMYNDAIETGDSDLAMRAHSKYITCFIMLEEITGKETILYKGKVVFEEDAPKDLEEE